MKGYVYILKSQNFNILYLGSTTDIITRELEHNKGTTKSTKNKGSWKIIRSWEFKSITEAKQIEYKIKKMKRKLSIDYISYFIDKYFNNKDD